MRIEVNSLGLTFSDVYIEPQYTEVNSRAEVETKSNIFDNFVLDVPVISANMDTITESDVAKSMFDSGGLGALHRFMSIRENVDEFLRCPNQTLVSVGVNGDSQERTKALYEAGARNFLVDIAHGHSLQMKEMLEWMKKNFSGINIMAGNVATFDAVSDLHLWGAQAVKVGIGPGAACLTKNVTGVTVPQITAIKNCVSSKIKWVDKSNSIPYIIADGGIMEIGDICKAFAAGADAVMCGRLFASCGGTPGPRLNGKKVYRGMASLDAMRKIRSDENLPTPEGASIVLDEPITTIEEVMRHIKGGLQSSFSYVGAKNLKEFQGKVILKVRK